MIEIINCANIHDSNESSNFAAKKLTCLEKEAAQNG